MTSEYIPTLTLLVNFLLVVTDHQTSIANHKVKLETVDMSPLRIIKKLDDLEVFMKS